ncbi:MAG: helix-turn-helix transcriptional regulator [Gammaproteobacteria bacterium]
MRRADRLFLLIQALRGRRVVTARRLAELLEVSERTVYRDVRDLQLSGIPIEGEAGVGYALRRGSDVPPLMFTHDELEALVVGARLVEAWTGSRLAQSARLALTKIEAVLPDELRQQQERSRLYAPPVDRHAGVVGVLDRLHAAIEAHEVLEVDYRREDGAATTRSLRPLCLAFWGAVWTLGAWCELRGDFRSFRLDRIAALRPAGRCFDETPETGLSAYLRAVDAERL